MSLDLRTIFVLIALLSLMMSVTMFITAYTSPYKAKSMRIWAIGTGLRSVFWAMLAFRGHLPEFFSIVLANAGVITSELILVKALRILKDKDLDDIWLYICGATSIVVLSIFTYLIPSVFWRVEYISIASLCVGIAGIHTLLITNIENRTRIEVVCGILYLICAIAVVVRGSFIILNYPNTPSLFDGGMVQNISFSVIFVSIVMITFIYVIMITSKFNNELRTALSEVKTLKSLLPICSYCKNIRDEQDDWHNVEDYLRKHTDTNFSHGICPSCFETQVAPELESFKQQIQN